MTMMPGHPGYRRWRHQRMVAFFIGGALVIGGIAAFVDSYQWPLAVAAYILASMPAYALWEWVERRKEKEAAQRFFH